MAKLPKVELGMTTVGSLYSLITAVTTSKYITEKKQNYSAAHWVMQSCALLLMNVTR